MIITQDFEGSTVGSSSSHEATYGKFVFKGNGSTNISIVDKGNISSTNQTQDKILFYSGYQVPDITAVSFRGVDNEAFSLRSLEIGSGDGGDQTFKLIGKRADYTFVEAFIDLTASSSDASGLVTFTRYEADPLYPQFPAGTLTFSGWDNLVEVSIQGGEQVGLDIYLDDILANFNVPATGSVTIQGSPTQGQTLTLVPENVNDVDGSGEFHYAWYAQNTDGTWVTIANGSDTLVLDEIHVGKAIKASVSFTDGLGSHEEIISMETQAVLAYSKPPIVHSSASYILAPGDKFVINEHMLRTDDNDNPPSEVVYTLTSVPNDGKLLLNGIALTIEQTFTQADINAGHVSIQASSQIEIEHFEFSVSDGTTSVPGHSFQVQTYVPPPVLPPPPASQPPIVEANFTLPVLVGDTLVLNDSMLRTVDLDTSPSDLVYTLTGLPDDGKLLLNGNPLTTGQTFTQADITAGHLSIQASGQAEIESFGFTVSDGITSVPGHSLQVQTFVPPVMPPLPITQPPFVEANVSVPVPVGDTLVLNDAMLRTVDLDTSPSGIVYTLTGLPDDGKLLFNGQPLATGQAFTQSDINAGHVSIRASGQAEIEHFGFTVSDGMTTILGQSFQVQTFILPPVVPPLPTIPPTPKPPTSPTQPTTPSETVDGVEVGRGEMTNGDGSISQVITIPVVTGERSEQVGNNSVADIPLAAIGSSGESLLTAQVPTGYGLQVTGNSAPVTAGTGLAGLIREIQAHTPAGSDDQSLLTGGGTGFLGGLAQTAPLLVQTLVPSMATGNAPTGPLVINGNPGASSPAATALVIDTTALPSGPLLELNNVEFAAVIGAATISGGAGAQRVWGDSASQTIVLGADDDVLHGGAGNDTVGSKGGDDVLFGDAGDDVVFGGEGNDRLSGGTGNDQLDGETGVDVARFETRFDQATLTWNDDGTLTVTTTATGTDTLQNVELLRFDDRVVLAQAPDLVTPQVMAFEESYYLGHNPDVAEAVARGDYANGYDHYVQYGAGEGRSTAERGAAFDEAYYLSHNPDVAAAVERGDFRSGYEHFAMYGQDEGRSVSDSRPAFDEAFYLAQNPDVAAAIAAGDLPDAFTHYSLYGQSEGRDPNALFDERWYRAENADVAAAVEQGTFDSAYEHYLAYGWEEGRDPSAWMDVEAYQAAHPDVAAAGIDPLGHFLMWGSMEGRVVSANDGDLWG